MPGNRILIKMTVAIHQPNYLPWIGYFYKIYTADIFIFHDNVEHSKRHPTRRVRIRARNNLDKPTWLTVPLEKHPDITTIKDLLVFRKQNWQKFHLRKIYSVYKDAPFFGRYFSTIEKALLASAKDYDDLAGMNIQLIYTIVNILGLSCQFFRSGKLPVKNLKGGAYNAALTRHVGGTKYLSGMGGKYYMSIDEFTAEGIEMEFTGFGDWLMQCPYPQAQGTKYLPGLSVLDGIFNLGAEGVVGLFEEFERK